tara:strand:- start:1567 stop:1920 length:354 start_codon:yes stop_codon:yes gene_type:complete
MKNLFFLSLVFFTYYNKLYAQDSTQVIITKSDSIDKSGSFNLAEEFLNEQLSKTIDKKTQFLLLAQLCQLSKTHHKVTKTVNYGHKALKKDSEKYKHLESYGDILYNIGTAKSKQEI